MLRSCASLLERFLRYVSPEPNIGCWLWLGAIDTAGYGVINRGRRGEGMERASRTAWSLFRGPIPQGASVLHRCDNRLCANPDHLFLGDAASNAQDMWSKGRAWQQRDPTRASLAGHRLAASGRAYRPPSTPPRPCENCSIQSKPLRRGLCHACDEYQRRHGGTPRPTAKAQ